MEKSSGLSHVRGERSLFEAKILHQAGKALGAGQADRFGACKDDPGAWMILQILANARQIADHGDIEVAQVLRRANAGEHENLRRSDCTAAQDDLALRALLRASGALLKAHNRGTLALEVNSKDVSICPHGEVGARGGRMQESRRGAVPLAVELRHLVKAEAVLGLAVEIMIAFESGFQSGFDKRVRERIYGAQIADTQGPSRSVVVRSAVFLFFRFLEVGQHVVIAPARVAEIAPAIVVSAVAADIDHRVDGAAAAQDLAPRPVQTALAQLGFRIGVVGPVTGSFKELAKSRRNMDFFPGVAAAGFQQQHFHFGIFTQAVGQHAPGGTGAYDDVVIHALTPSGTKRRGKEIVARNQRLSFNRRKRHFGGFTFCLPFPVGEQLRVGKRDVLLGGNVQQAGCRINPLWRAFNLAVVADGGFVQNHVTGRVAPLAAELLIAKARLESELFKYPGSGLAIFDRGLDLAPRLVTPWLRAAFVLISEGPFCAELAHPQQGAPAAKLTPRLIIEGVQLVGSRRKELETGASQAAGEGCHILDQELDFDFAVFGHGQDSIKKRRPWDLAGDRNSFCIQRSARLFRTGTV